MPRGTTRWVLVAVVATVALAWIAGAVDGAALAHAAGAVLADPLPTTAVLGAYGVAFVLRAIAWRRVVPDLEMGHALAAIHVALAGNHVLPFRLGEPLRIASVVRRTPIDAATATASTVTLRAADVAALATLAALAAPRMLGGALERWGTAVVVVAVVAGVGAVAGAVWMRRTLDPARVRVPGPAVAVLTVAAWTIEAVVIWYAAGAAGVALSPLEAVGVTAITVAAQLLAVAPGGFGTYEAAGTAALVALGTDAPTALAIALVAHALKTVYALLAGVVGLVAPSPGMFGRLRVPRQLPSTPRHGVVPVDAPVVLFLPAYNEAAVVGQVVSRIPAEVLGRPVIAVVVDDGSDDGTADVARAAGAIVVAHESNRGLGAAVRTGFADGVARGAAAVAFCDADGEYAPEELERLVAPIVAGDADYVAGSRFAGRIDRMHPHRRFGNRVLTVMLSFVARRRITDGQTGYRALSAAAARQASVVHDYNYAQVLTLELLLKGFRYREVPISYGFRTVGSSFVRPVRYLRRVVPAVWRVLNEPPQSSTT